MARWQFGSTYALAQLTAQQRARSQCKPMHCAICDAAVSRAFYDWLGIRRVCVRLEDIYAEDAARRL